MTSRAKIRSFEELVEHLDPYIVKRASEIFQQSLLDWNGGSLESAPMGPHPLGDPGVHTGALSPSQAPWVAQLLAEHEAKDFVEAHRTGEASKNRQRKFFSYDNRFGITGGDGIDEGARIQAMIDYVGERGGGICVITPSKPDDILYINQIVSNYYSHVEIDWRNSDVVYGPEASQRIMGAFSELPPNGVNAAGLAATSSVDANERTVLTLRTGEGTHFAEGKKIVIRGPNFPNGQAKFKDIAIVHSVVGDVVTLTTKLENVYEPEYPGSGYIPPGGTVDRTTIYIMEGSLFVSDVNAGSRYAVVADVGTLQKGDLLLVNDNQTEFDVNPSAISGDSGKPFRNRANQEFVYIEAIDEGTNTITFDRALERDYATANYGGVSKMLPVEHSSIRNCRVRFDADQTHRNIHVFQIAYSAQCYFENCHVDGANGQKGQGFRISDSYLCYGTRCSNKNPKYLNSAEGYCFAWYYSTACWFEQVLAMGGRHSYLFQGTTRCILRNFLDINAKITGVDWHGVNEVGDEAHTGLILGGEAAAPGVSNRSGARAGNTSHTPGCHRCILRDVVIAGWSKAGSSAVDFVPASTGFVVRNVYIYDSELGVRFTGNSGHITPEQTCSGILLDGVHVTRCNTPFDLDSPPNGTLDKLVVTDCKSIQNSKHFEFEGVTGYVAVTYCQVIDPVASAGGYAFRFDGCEKVQLSWSDAGEANRGVYYANNTHVSITHNNFHLTTEAHPVEVGTGNTGTITVQLNTPFDGGDGGLPDDAAPGTALAHRITEGSPGTPAPVAIGDLLLDHLLAGEGIIVDSIVPNKVHISAYGFATTAHTHLAGDITNFGDAAATVATLTLADQFGGAGHVLIGTGVDAYTSRQLVTTDISGFTAAVDARVAAAVGDYLPLTGGRLTGPLTIGDTYLTTIDSPYSLWVIANTPRIFIENGDVTENLPGRLWLIGNEDVYDAGYAADLGHFRIRAALRAEPGSDLIGIQSYGLEIGWEGQHIMRTVHDDYSLLLSTNNTLIDPALVFGYNENLRGSIDYDLSANLLRFWNRQAGEIQFLVESSPAMLIAEFGKNLITLGDETDGALTVVQRSSDEILRISHISATGSPKLVFHQVIERSYIQHHDTDDVLRLASKYGPVSIRPGASGSDAERVRVSTDKILLTEWLHLNRNSDIQLVLDTVSASGNPVISFRQAGTQRAAVYYAHNDRLDLRSYYNDVVIAPGSGGTSAIAFRVRVSDTSSPARATLSGINAALSVARNAAHYGAVVQNMQEINISYARVWFGHNAIWHEATSRWKVLWMGANDATGLLIPNGGGFWFIQHESIGGGVDRDITHSTFTTGDINQSSATGITNPIVSISRTGDLNIKGILGDSIGTITLSSGWTNASIHYKKVGRTVFVFGGFVERTTATTLEVGGIKVGDFPSGIDPTAASGSRCLHVDNSDNILDDTWLQVNTSGELRMTIIGGAPQPAQGRYFFAPFCFEIQ